MCQLDKSDRGATTVAKGLGFENAIAALLNCHKIDNANLDSVSLLREICLTLNINFSQVKNAVAYRQYGTKKADVILCLMLENYETCEINISLKGTMHETQFANIKTENFISVLSEQEAKTGYQKFTGHSIYKDMWSNEYGHENRQRYYKSELEYCHRQSMHDCSLESAFRTMLFNGVFGDSDNKIDLIIAPKNSWSLQVSDLLIINAQKVRKLLEGRYEVLPFTFMNNDLLHVQHTKKVVCKKTKEGKLITPEGQGSFSFANDLIKIKRKGSESSVKDGFDPTDIQLVCSAKSLFELQYM